MKRRFAETLLLNVNGLNPGICPSVAIAVIAALGVAKMTNAFAPLLAMWMTWLLIHRPRVGDVVRLRVDDLVRVR